MRQTLNFTMRILAALLVLSVTTHGQAQAFDQIKTKAQQAILLDYDTGMVLFEKNADERMPTSSMSKVMTMYLVFEALKDGQIELDDHMQVSEKAWRKGGSKMFVEVNDRVKIEDLIRGVLVQSGNDATIVLAEGLAGTEQAFAKALNIKAQELGMKDSHFMNASGWPDPDHYSTARDLARLARATITNFSEYYPYFSEREFTYNDITQKNRNPLLYRGIGADGVKTGHTEVGGYGLIGSGTKNNRRVILVINGLSSEKERAQESAKLMEWGLRGFKNFKLFESGKVVEQAGVAMGEQKTVPLMLKEDVMTTIPTLASAKLKVEVSYEGPVEAPIAKGDEIAQLSISSESLQPVVYPLYAAEDVDRLGFFSLTMQKAKLLLKGELEERL